MSCVAGHYTCNTSYHEVFAGYDCQYKADNDVLETPLVPRSIEKVRLAAT